MDSKALTDARLDELIALAARDPHPPTDWMRDTDAALRELKRSRARIEAAPHASGCIHWRWVSASTNGDGGDGPHCNCWKSESNPEPITAPRTRNSEALNSFVAYCRAHPTWRFWQALRNWSSFGFILGADTRDGGTIDTFHMEGLDGCRDTPRVADEDSEALMPGGFND